MNGLKETCETKVSLNSFFLFKRTKSFASHVFKSYTNCSRRSSQHNDTQVHCTGDSRATPSVHHVKDNKDKKIIGRANKILPDMLKEYEWVNCTGKKPPNKIHLIYLVWD